ncbi:hypothetical protein MMC16_005761 [Acarospora aff. strigata]|nr:hypothetical protein [Acarospora aff. strigata]
MPPRSQVYPDEEWQAREAKIYYLRCFKGMSCESIAEHLRKIAEHLVPSGNFQPSVSSLKRQMTVWNFRCGVTWDLKDTPESYLEAIGLKKSPGTSQHGQYIFVVADEQSEQTARPEVLDTLDFGPERFTLSKEHSSTQTSLTLNGPVVLGPQLHDNYFKTASMSLGALYDYHTPIGAAPPSTMVANGSSYGTTSSQTGHNQHHWDSDLQQTNTARSANGSHLWWLSTNR